MKKFLVSAATLALIAPAVALAAYNDVTLSTDVILSANSITLNLSGSGATIESLTVDSGSFSVTLPTGADLEITSNDKYTLASSNGSVVVTSECTASISRLILENTGTASVTTTITPTATACTTSGGSSGGSGGGSGGIPSLTSSPTPTPTPTPTLTPTPTPASASGTQATVAALVAQLQSLIQLYMSLGGTVTPEMAVFAGRSSSFTRNLEIGMTGGDVKALQVFLNTHGYPVAASGSGSPGNETTMFGGATKAALAKFQKANGISPAAGYFGSKTRAVVNGM